MFGGSGPLTRHCAHQGGSISPLMIFTTYDASANSVVTIAKVTLVEGGGFQPSVPGREIKP